ncbi:hypothetical protein BYT27DRAFT_7255014 [Phlegmacium glaucopus]|nr:hypothetical protein BYT27DRAFT_7255014 [Phlegmacium glaucopus]
MQAYLSGSSNLQQSGTPVKCNILKIVTLLDPANVLCVSQHYLPFPPIVYGSATDIGKHAAVYTHSQKWLTFKDPLGIWVFEGSSKTSSLIQSASTSQSASTNQSTSTSHASTMESTGHSKTPCPKHSRASAQGAPCMDEEPYMLLDLQGLEILIEDEIK